MVTALPLGCAGAVVLVAWPAGAVVLVACPAAAVVLVAWPAGAVVSVACAAAAVVFVACAAGAVGAAVGVSPPHAASSRLRTVRRAIARQCLLNISFLL